MSSLTKFLRTGRRRPQVSDQGGSKKPMLLTFPLSPELEEVCISLLSGDWHMVRVVPERLTRTGFFELKLEEEDKAHGELVDFLYERGVERGWGGVAETVVPDEEDLKRIWEYFGNYDLSCKQIFVGLVGFAVLVTAGFLDLPVDTKDPDTIDNDVLWEWMEEYFHVGKIKGIPVYFNPHLREYIVFSSSSENVGAMTRVGEHVSVLVHNAERGLVILQVDLDDEALSIEDSAGKSEKRTEENSD